MMIFRPGQRLVIPGAQVFQPMASAASGGWWDNFGAISGCICAYAAKGAADLAASYINLANPGTYNASPGVAPTLDSSGWVFNGSSQYLTTGIVPTASYTVICRYSNWTLASDKTLFGLYGSGTTSFAAKLSSPTATQWLRGGTLNVGIASTSGVLALAGKNAYRNGSSDGTVPVGGTDPTLAIMIAAMNNGSALELSAVKIQAFAIYNRTLSGAEIATETTLINAL